MARRARSRWGALALRNAILAVVAQLACTRGPAPGTRPLPPAAADARLTRVSLGVLPAVTLSATSRWQLVDRGGTVVSRGDSGARTTASVAGDVIRIGDARGGDAPLTLSSSAGIVSVNGRRYRGELSLSRSDSGLLVVNRVDVEAYLRGVVPRELGIRGPAERAALEAQAVAARSYAVVRLHNASRAYDLVATTADQVYGGVESENALADAAVAATEALVLMYDGRIVNAPYSSTCGGTTAEPSEVWRSRNEPFLQRVSDRIPGSDRFYCDIAPRFRWERSWRADTLTAIVERYLRAYAQVPAGPIGSVRGISVEGRTPSGRVEAISLETDRGRYRLQGNDIRYVLRSPGGELLNSTYFSPDIVAGSDGRLSRLTIRGLGYGHGIGMCQWGAIGRARAGQDFRTILRTYFPGTNVARAY
jgi:stage II sporulation protein D